MNIRVACRNWEIRLADWHRVAKSETRELVKYWGDTSEIRKS